MKKLLVVLLLFSMVGCAGTSQHIDDSRFVTKVNVEGSIFLNPIEDITAGRSFDKQISQEIHDALKQRIQKSKYQLAENKTQADYILNIKMTQFTAGNRALRFWISYGAGTAKMSFECELFDSQGNLVDSQIFQRFAPMSLRSGNTLIGRMKDAIIGYTSNWIGI